MPHPLVLLLDFRNLGARLFREKGLGNKFLHVVNAGLSRVVEVGSIKAIIP